MAVKIIRTTDNSCTFSISGKEYEYTVNGLTGEEIKKKLNSLSLGKDMAWIRKEGKLVTKKEADVKFEALYGFWTSRSRKIFTWIPGWKNDLRDFNENHEKIYKHSGKIYVGYRDYAVEIIMDKKLSVDEIKKILIDEAYPRDEMIKKMDSHTLKFKKYSCEKVVDAFKKALSEAGVDGTVSTNSADRDENQETIRSAETQIKVSSESAQLLRNFVNKHLGELNANHNITTFFIDTPQEYEKFNVPIPGICLVVADKRASKASLKKEPIVQKFDKSKTLKRYSDWKKGQVPNCPEPVWYTIYVSAKEARDNNIAALHEEYFGYIDSDGDVVCMQYCNEDADGARLTTMVELEANFVQYRVDEDGDIWVR